MFENHIKYLKDNPNNLWFKRKLYGWGWTPVKWQGWVVILAYILILFILFKDVDPEVNTFKENLIPVFLLFIILTVILIGICYKKGESPKWQWGPPKE